MEAPRVDTGLQNPNCTRPAADDRADDQEPLNCERPAAEDRGAGDRPDDRADNQDVQGEPPNFAGPAVEDRADDDRADGNRADDDQDVLQREPPHRVRPAAEGQQPAAFQGERAVEEQGIEGQACDGGPHDQNVDVQGEPRYFGLYVAVGFSLIVFIAFVVGFHFDSEISKKEEVERACYSQQKKLRNEVQGCMANLSAMYGEVNRLQLAKMAVSGTIDCLQKDVEDFTEWLREKQSEYDQLQSEYDQLQDDYRDMREENILLKHKNQTQTETIEEKKKEENDCKTRLSEKMGEYDHLQDEYRKKWQEKEQLEQKNKAKTETIETKTKEINDLEAKLSEKVGEYNHLQDEYKKKWQEKEQLEQKKKAQTETIQAKTKEVDDLKAKLKKMQNERDCAKDDYGKEKQENDKCKSELRSESKMVQEQKQINHDLSIKLQTTEKRCHDQKKEESVNGGSIVMGIIAIVLIVCICIAFCGNNSK